MADENIKLTDEELQAELATEIEDSVESGTEKNIRSREEVLRERNAANRQREQQINERQKQVAAESSIESVRRTRTILTGRITAAEDNTVDGKDTACAVIMLDRKTKAIVPYSEMFNTNLIDMTTVDLSTADGEKRYLARQRQIIAKMNGLDVPVIITRVIPDADGEGHSEIIASRKEAAAVLRRVNLAEDSPLCIKDGYYDATVISVSNHSVAATYNGYDFVIPQYALTERYILNLNSYYNVGDRLPFRLKKIERDPQTGDVTGIETDTKEAELKAAHDNFYLLKVNSIVRGVITKVYKAGPKVNIHAWLPDYEVPCKIPFMNPNDFGKEIVSGDEVQLIITGFRTSGYVEGRIRSLHGNASIFNI